MMRRIKLLGNVLSLLMAGLVGAETEVFPPEIMLEGRRDQVQLVVTRNQDGQLQDLTRGATYEVENPAIVSVSENGVVNARSNGTTRVVIDGVVSKVVVTGVEEPAPISFRHETLPLFSRLGCSAGSCHGSPHGKGSFRLSLRASDAGLDQETVVMEEFGRRTNPIEPEKSLLLLKPLTEVSHEGGKKLEKGSPEYELLKGWIQEGAQVQESKELHCVGIELFPASARVLKFPHAEQQIAVHARFSDGSKRDVTHLAVFESSDTKVAVVTRSGLVRGVERGDLAVIVRYLEHIESVSLTLVREVEGFEWKNPPVANYIDTHVYAKLRQLQFEPAPLSGDREFIRRLYLDLTGLLPAPEKVEAFVADNRAEKRVQLIDELLESENHASYWAQKWGDLLRVSKKQLGSGPVYKLNRWLVNTVAENVPYDQFARDLLTAQGSSRIHPAANYYRAAADTLDAMETSAQLFLGSRIQCAKCHNHPFERWTQDNYYGLAAFFNRIERRKTGKGSELVVIAKKDGEVMHPERKEPMKPWAPKGGNLEIPNERDRREAFADWLTKANNPFFAHVEVNRIWAYLMGRGIVEPFDDFRDTNPPTNPPLLAALAKDFVALGYDRRALLRKILNSRTYQATSRTTPLNKDDTRYFSHYQPRMLTAEQLVDALGDITGRPMQFVGVPPSTRATQLPAPDLKPHNRGRIGEIEFMKVFGQPERQTICECERGDDSSLGQALELFNGRLVNGMISSGDGRLHRWIKEGVADEEIVTRFYQRALCRPPVPRELELHLAYLKKAENHMQALEDTLWIVLNKSEFLFQH